MVHWIEIFNQVFFGFNCCKSFEKLTDDDRQAKAVKMKMIKLKVVVANKVFLSSETLGQYIKRVSSQNLLVKLRVPFLSRTNRSSI